ncbi:MAG: cobalamin 5'-phosphate synthase (cobS, cobV) [Cenarchaeum symbiont of Oopsacas minuta]|nr:cobalamin 5'-phosphate synthase (cobS, cobV) [Cenarchaeum symbiont of Oopsacas minuta]
MHNPLASVLSFLTLVPSGSHTLEDTAKNMHIFPAIGIAMGFVLGMVGLGLSYAGADPIITAFFLVAATMVVTGLHHTDGLADFADGLMRKGKASEKLAAMRDINVGTGGIAAIILYVVGMVAALSVADGEMIFWMILFGEAMAKFSMVLVASMGSPTRTGSSLPFVDAMRHRWRLVVASAITLVPLVAFGGPVAIVALACSSLVAVLTTILAERGFGGITGDVIGAANELGRLSFVMAYVVFS